MAATSSTKKVLTIDDEQAIVDLIVDILEANHYTAISATQWTDALDALNHENPDLVLLDLKMPTIHGTSMLDFLRSEGFTVPIIVVSGFVTESVASELQRQGVHGVVRKPFKASHLIAEVEKALGKKTKAPASQNALDALYNRPPAPLPEPDENGSTGPSMDALYGNMTEANSGAPGAQDRAETQKAQAPVTPEASILEALQKASHKDSQRETPQKKDAAPPADLLETPQKREQPAPKSSQESASKVPSRTEVPTPPPVPTRGDTDGSAGNPILDAPLTPLPPRPESRDPFAQRASSPSRMPRRRRMDRKTMLFLGGITLVCILMAGFLGVMQYLASEAPMALERIKAEAQDVVKTQAKKEVQKQLQEQQQQLQQQAPK